MITHRTIKAAYGRNPSEPVTVTIDRVEDTWRMAVRDQKDGTYHLIITTARPTTHVLWTELKSAGYYKLTA